MLFKFSLYLIVKTSFYMSNSEKTPSYVKQRENLKGFLASFHQWVSP